MPKAIQIKKKKRFIIEILENMMKLRVSIEKKLKK